MRVIDAAVVLLCSSACLAAVTRGLDDSARHAQVSRAGELLSSEQPPHGAEERSPAFSSPEVLGETGTAGSVAQPAGAPVDGGRQTAGGRRAADRPRRTASGSVEQQAAPARDFDTSDASTVDRFAASGADAVNTERSIDGKDVVQTTVAGGKVDAAAHLFEWQLGTTYTLDVDMRFFQGKGTVHGAEQFEAWEPPSDSPRSVAIRCSLHLSPVRAEACHACGVATETGGSGYGNEADDAVLEARLVHAQLEQCQPSQSLHGGPWQQLRLPRHPVTGEPLEYDTEVSQPFFFSVLSTGQVARLYVNASESAHSVNFKKGTAALFSFTFPDSSAFDGDTEGPASLFGETSTNGADRRTQEMQSFQFRPWRDESFLEFGEVDVDLDASAGDSLDHPSLLAAESHWHGQMSARRLAEVGATPEALLPSRGARDGVWLTHDETAMEVISTGGLDTDTSFNNEVFPVRQRSPVLRYDAVDEDESGLFAAHYHLRRLDAATLQLRRDVSRARLLRSGTAEAEANQARSVGIDLKPMHYKTSVVDIDAETRTPRAFRVRALAGAAMPDASEYRPSATQEQYDNADYTRRPPMHDAQEPIISDDRIGTNPNLPNTYMDCRIALVREPRPADRRLFAAVELGEESIDSAGIPAGIRMLHLPEVRAGDGGDATGSTVSRTTTVAFAAHTLVHDADPASRNPGDDDDEDLDYYLSCLDKSGPEPDVDAGQPRPAECIADLAAAARRSPELLDEVLFWLEPDNVADLQLMSANGLMALATTAAVVGTDACQDALVTLLLEMDYRVPISHAHQDTAEFHHIVNVFGEIQRPSLRVVNALLEALEVHRGHGDQFSAILLVLGTVGSHLPPDSAGKRHILDKLHAEFDGELAANVAAERDFDVYRREATKEWDTMEPSWRPSWIAAAHGWNALQVAEALESATPDEHAEWTNRTLDMMARNLAHAAGVHVDAYGVPHKPRELLEGLNSAINVHAPELRTTVQALANFGHPESVDRVVSVAEHAYLPLRAAGIHALFAFPGNDGAERVLSDAIGRRDEDPAVREAAVEALLNWPVADVSSSHRPLRAAMELLAENDNDGVDFSTCKVTCRAKCRYRELERCQQACSQRCKKHEQLEDAAARLLRSHYDIDADASAFGGAIDVHERVHEHDISTKVTDHATRARAARRLETRLERLARVYSATKFDWRGGVDEGFWLEVGARPLVAAGAGFGVTDILEIKFGLFGGLFEINLDNFARATIWVLFFPLDFFHAKLAFGGGFSWAVAPDGGALTEAKAIYGTFTAGMRDATWRLAGYLTNLAGDLSGAMSSLTEWVPTAADFEAIVDDSTRIIRDASVFAGERLPEFARATQELQDNLGTIKYVASVATDANQPLVELVASPDSVFATALSFSDAIEAHHDRLRPAHAAAVAASEITVEKLATAESRMFEATKGIQEPLDEINEHVLRNLNATRDLNENVDAVDRFFAAADDYEDTRAWLEDNPEVVTAFEEVLPSIDDALADVVGAINSIELVSSGDLLSIEGLRNTLIGFLTSSTAKSRSEVMQVARESIDAALGTALDVVSAHIAHALEGPNDAAAAFETSMQQLEDAITAARERAGAALVAMSRESVLRAPLTTAQEETARALEQTAVVVETVLARHINAYLDPASSFGSAREDAQRAIDDSVWRLQHEILPEAFTGIADGMDIIVDAFGDGLESEFTASRDGANGLVAAWRSVDGLAHDVALGLPFPAISSVGLQGASSANVVGGASSAAEAVLLDSLPEVFGNAMEVLGPSIAAMIKAAVDGLDVPDVYGTDSLGVLTTTAEDGAASLAELVEAVQERPPLWDSHAGDDFDMESVEATAVAHLVNDDIDFLRSRLGTGRNVNDTRLDLDQIGIEVGSSIVNGAVAELNSILVRTVASIQSSVEYEQSESVQDVANTLAGFQQSLGFVVETARTLQSGQEKLSSLAIDDDVWSSLSDSVDAVAASSWIITWRHPIVEKFMLGGVSTMAATIGKVELLVRLSALQLGLAAARGLTETLAAVPSGLNRAAWPNYALMGEVEVAATEYDAVLGVVETDLEEPVMRALKGISDAMLHVLQHAQTDSVSYSPAGALRVLILMLARKTDPVLDSNVSTLLFSTLPASVVDSVRSLMEIAFPVTRLHLLASDREGRTVTSWPERLASRSVWNSGWVGDASVRLETLAAADDRDGVFESWGENALRGSWIAIERLLDGLDKFTLVHDELELDPLLRSAWTSDSAAALVRFSDAIRTISSDLQTLNEGNEFCQPEPDDNQAGGTPPECSPDPLTDFSDEELHRLVGITAALRSEIKQFHEMSTPGPAVQFCTIVIRDIPTDVTTCEKVDNPPKDLTQEQAKRYCNDEGACRWPQKTVCETTKEMLPGETEECIDANDFTAASAVVARHAASPAVSSTISELAASLEVLEHFVASAYSGAGRYLLNRRSMMLRNALTAAFSAGNVLERVNGVAGATLEDTAAAARALLPAASASVSVVDQEYFRMIHRLGGPNGHLAANIGHYLRTAHAAIDGAVRTLDRLRWYYVRLLGSYDGPTVPQAARRILQAIDSQSQHSVDVSVGAVLRGELDEHRDRVEAFVDELEWILRNNGTWISETPALSGIAFLHNLLRPLVRDPSLDTLRAAADPVVSGVKNRVAPLTALVDANAALYRQARVTVTPMWHLPRTADVSAGEDDTRTWRTELVRDVAVAASAGTRAAAAQVVQQWLLDDTDDESVTFASPTEAKASVLELRAALDMGDDFQASVAQAIDDATSSASALWDTDDDRQLSKQDAEQLARAMAPLAEILVDSTRPSSELDPSVSLAVIYPELSSQAARDLLGAFTPLAALSVDLQLADAMRQVRSIRALVLANDLFSDLANAVAEVAISTGGDSDVMQKAAAVVEEARPGVFREVRAKVDRAISDLFVDTPVSVSDADAIIAACNGIIDSLGDFMADATGSATGAVVAHVLRSADETVRAATRLLEARGNRARTGADPLIIDAGNGVRSDQAIEGVRLLTSAAEVVRSVFRLSGVDEADIAEVAAERFGELVALSEVPVFSHAPSLGSGETDAIPYYSAADALAHGLSVAQRSLMFSEGLSSAKESGALSVGLETADVDVHVADKGLSLMGLSLRAMPLFSLYELHALLEESLAALGEGGHMEPYTARANYVGAEQPAFNDALELIDAILTPPAPSPSRREGALSASEASRLGVAAMSVAAASITIEAAYAAPLGELAADVNAAHILQLLLALRVRAIDVGVSLGLHDASVKTSRALMPLRLLGGVKRMSDYASTVPNNVVDAVNADPPISMDELEDVALGVGTYLIDWLDFVERTTGGLPLAEFNAALSAFMNGAAFELIGDALADSIAEFQSELLNAELLDRPGPHGVRAGAPGDEQAAVHFVSLLLDLSAKLRELRRAMVTSAPRAESVTSEERALFADVMDSLWFLPGVQMSMPEQAIIGAASVAGLGELMVRVFGAYEVAAGVREAEGTAASQIVDGLADLADEVRAQLPVHPEDRDRFSPVQLATPYEALQFTSYLALDLGALANVEDDSRILAALAHADTIIDALEDVSLADIALSDGDPEQLQLVNAEIGELYTALDEFVKNDTVHAVLASSVFAAVPAHLRGPGASFSRPISLGATLRAYLSGISDLRRTVALAMLASEITNLRVLDAAVTGMVEVADAIESQRESVGEPTIYPSVDRRRRRRRLAIASLLDGYEHNFDVWTAWARSTFGTVADSAASSVTASLAATDERRTGCSGLAMTADVADSAKSAMAAYIDELAFGQSPGVITASVFNMVLTVNMRVTRVDELIHAALDARCGEVIDVLSARAATKELIHEVAALTSSAEVASAISLPGGTAVLPDSLQKSVRSLRGALAGALGFNAVAMRSAIAVYVAASESPLYEQVASLLSLGSISNVDEDAGSQCGSLTDIAHEVLPLAYANSVGAYVDLIKGLQANGTVGMDEVARAKQVIDAVDQFGDRAMLLASERVYVDTVARSATRTGLVLPWIATPPANFSGAPGYEVVVRAATMRILLLCSDASRHARAGALVDSLHAAMSGAAALVDDTDVTLNDAASASLQATVADTVEAVGADVAGQMLQALCQRGSAYLLEVVELLPRVRTAIVGSVAMDRSACNDLRTGAQRAAAGCPDMDTARRLRSSVELIDEVLALVNRQPAVGASNLIRLVPPDYTSAAGSDAECELEVGTAFGDPRLVLLLAALKMELPVDVVSSGVDVLGLAADARIIDIAASLDAAGVGVVEARLAPLALIIDNAVARARLLDELASSVLGASLEALSAMDDLEHVAGLVDDLLLRGSIAQPGIRRPGPQPVLSTRPTPPPRPVSLFEGGVLSSWALRSMLRARDAASDASDSVFVESLDAAVASADYASWIRFVRANPELFDGAMSAVAAAAEAGAGTATTERLSAMAFEYIAEASLAAGSDVLRQVMLSAATESRYALLTTTLDRLDNSDGTSRASLLATDDDVFELRWLLVGAPQEAYAAAKVLAPPEVAASFVYQAADAFSLWEEELADLDADSVGHDVVYSAHQLLAALQALVQDEFSSNTGPAWNGGGGSIDVMRYDAEAAAVSARVALHLAHTLPDLGLSVPDEVLAVASIAASFSEAQCYLSSCSDADVAGAVAVAAALADASTVARVSERSPSRALWQRDGVAALQRILAAVSHLSTSVAPLSSPVENVGQIGVALDSTAAATLDDVSVVVESVESSAVAVEYAQQGIATLRDWNNTGNVAGGRQATQYFAAALRSLWEADADAEVEATATIRRVMLMVGGTYMSAAVDAVLDGVSSASQLVSVYASVFARLQAMHQSEVIAAASVDDESGESQEDASEPGREAYDELLVGFAAAIAPALTELSTLPTVADLNVAVAAVVAGIQAGPAGSEGVEAVEADVLSELNLLSNRLSAVEKTSTLPLRGVDDFWSGSAADLLSALSQMSAAKTALLRWTALMESRDATPSVNLLLSLLDAVQPGPRTIDEGLHHLAPDLQSGDTLLEMLRDVGVAQNAGANARVKRRLLSEAATFTENVLSSVVISRMTNAVESVGVIVAEQLDLVPDATEALQVTASAAELHDALRDVAGSFGGALDETIQTAQSLSGVLRVFAASDTPAQLDALSEVIDDIRDATAVTQEAWFAATSIVPELDAFTTEAGINTGLLQIELRNAIEVVGDSIVILNATMGNLAPLMDRVTRDMRRSIIEGAAEADLLEERVPFESLLDVDNRIDAVAAFEANPQHSLRRYIDLSTHAVAVADQVQDRADILPRMTEVADSFVAATEAIEAIKHVSAALQELNDDIRVLLLRKGALRVEGAAVLDAELSEAEIIELVEANNDLTTMAPTAAAIRQRLISNMEQVMSLVSKQYYEGLGEWVDVTSAIASVIQQGTDRFETSALAVGFLHRRRKSLERTLDSLVDSIVPYASAVNAARGRMSDGSPARAALRAGKSASAFLAAINATKDDLRLVARELPSLLTAASQQRCQDGAVCALDTSLFRLRMARQRLSSWSEGIRALVTFHDGVDDIDETVRIMRSGLDDAPSALRAADEFLTSSNDAITSFSAALPDGDGIDSIEALIDRAHDLEFYRDTAALSISSGYDSLKERWPPWADQLERSMVLMKDTVQVYLDGRAFVDKASTKIALIERIPALMDTLTEETALAQTARHNLADLLSAGAAFRSRPLARSDIARAGARRDASVFIDQLATARAIALPAESWLRSVAAGFERSEGYGVEPDELTPWTRLDYCGNDDEGAPCLRVTQQADDFYRNWVFPSKYFRFWCKLACFARAV